MTPEDKFALKEFITGAGVVVGVIAAIMIALLLLANSNTDVSNPTSSGEVVGKYKECDIIRWTQHNLAEYKYFMYCEKNK